MVDKFSFVDRLDRGRHVKRCEDYTRERKSEFIMECPKDRDDGCLTVFQGMYAWGPEYLRGV